jgi:hypothetical protein
MRVEPHALEIGAYPQGEEILNERRQNMIKPDTSATA